ncbi:unnamed protein product [Bursaphelenchus xylophilus]|nr:unnamed protein product [Bursaphelenchus xylophilus]CAG9131077.1 unnamed protein product [Bursaphelenchus xylophilus]
MTCNNFLQNLFLSKFTDLKTFNIEFIVTYGGMRDGIMEISIPSKSGDTGRIVVTIANDEKQFEDQETTKISLTLDVQKKDRRDTERRNAMFYDKKPDRLYCAQWKYDNTVDIHYMTPGQDQPVKVLSTPNTCVKLQSPHISVDQEHLFLIFSCQHDTYIMYYNAKTKECIWHEVNGHFQDMFQWANQLLIRTEDGLTHISADHTMLRSTWSTSISNSIRMTESVYAFHQNSYVSFAFIENGMFKIKKTMIYAGELAKLKRRCSSILTVKDGFGSNTYFFEVFNGNLVYDKISRRLVYDNASA